MIVSDQKDKIVMVKQADHGIHAGTIVSHWGNNEFAKPTPNDALVHAINNHDIGWKEVDEKVLYDAERKRPLHFVNIDLLHHLEFYEASYKTIMDKDIYGGILMGMHWVGLYTRRYGYQPDFVFDKYDEVEKAVTAMEKEWVELKQKLWTPDQPRSDFENQMWMHYEIFQFIDRFSLTICMSDHDLQKETVIGPVRTSLNAPRINITMRTSGDGKVHVSPFPFDGEFEVEVPATKIPNRPYESHQDLVDEISKTKPEIVRVRICP